MFHQVIRATIAALFLLPVYAHAGPIIVYQAIESTYIVDSVAVDRIAGESDAEEFTQGLTLDPENVDVVAAAVLENGRASSTFGLSVNLDESNNTFSFNASIAAISDPSEEIFASGFVQVRNSIDFTIESDTDDLVELVFSVDASRPGLENTDIFIASATTRLSSDSGTSLSFFGLDPANAVSGTESFLVRPGELFRLFTVAVIQNRDTRFPGAVDAVGNVQLTSSLQVQSVPEPWSLAMLGFGLLTIGWRRTRGHTSQALG